MTDWKLLIDDLVSCHSSYTQNSGWAGTLSDSNKTRFFDINQKLFVNLLFILKSRISDEAKENRCREYLSAYGTLVFSINSSIDYTLNYQFPLNQVFLKVATFIRKKDEPICKILLPTIEKVIGTTVASDDFLSATEENDQFFPQYFLITYDGKALISLKDIFELTYQNTEFLFPTLEGSNLPLSPEDHERIRFCVGEKSQQLYDTLKYVHELNFDGPRSVGSELKKLFIALKNASATQKGSETVAPLSECRLPILRFYQVWMSLSQEIRDHIKNYRSPDAQFPLESFVLALALYFNGTTTAIDNTNVKVDLSENECNRIFSEQIVPCANHIYLQLQSIWKNNHDLKEILLDHPFNNRPSKISEFEIKKLLNEYLIGLETREPIKGISDSNCLFSAKIFETSSLMFNHERLIITNCKMVAILTRNIQEFTCALMILPKQYWEIYLEPIKSHLKQFFKFGKNSLIYLLKYLPKNDWQYFFNLIHTLDITENIIEAKELGLYVDELTKEDLKVFVPAIKPLLPVIFSSGKDIYQYFSSTLAWSSHYQLFYEDINNVLKTPADFGRLFNATPFEEWRHLSEMFLPLMQNYHVDDFLSDFLLSILPELRIYFFIIVSFIFGTASFSLSTLIKSLHLIPFGMWDELLRIWGFENISPIVSNPNEFEILIKNIDRKDLPFFLRKIEPYIGDISVDGLTLYNYLQTLPDCKPTLALLFGNQLPFILSRCMSNLALYEYNLKMIPCNELEIFKTLVEFSFVPLLGVHSLEKNCPSFKFSILRLFRNPDSVANLSNDFIMIETQVALQKMDPAEAFRIKILKINDFIENTRSHIIAHTVFYDELMGIFPGDFFSQMKYYFSSIYPIKSSLVTTGIFSNPSSSVNSTVDNTVSELPPLRVVHRR